MSLREDQKTARRLAILEAAAKVYGVKGYDATRAEDISKAAGVSTATLYNYFGGKGDLLMTLVTLESERILEATESLVTDPPASAMDAFQTLFAAYFDPKAILLNRDLWRQGIALSFSETATEASRRFREVDRDLAAQVQALAERLKARGALRGNVEPRAFGMALFNNVNMLFFEYSRSDDMSLETLRTLVSDTVGAVVSIAEPGRVQRG